jgi:acetoacetyl-CoA synthetase
VPKGLVHGHGGIVLEHLKALGLHLDVQRGDRVLWFTTTGWMMWNLTVSSLLHGATCVLYDGSPTYPDVEQLWRVAADTETTLLGTSPAYLSASRAAELQPRQVGELQRLRTLGSTGAPLTSDTARWASEALGPEVLVASISGGTDVCSAFVGSCPILPAVAGEMQCRMLGAAVRAFAADGTEVEDAVGELVITAPMPSMPLELWNDRDGSQMRESYFAPWPGVWRHGDWMRVTPRGSVVITGRSDATLNRRGVRMGTSEFYRVVEAQPTVRDALVIDTSTLDHEGELLVLVVLDERADEIDAFDGLRRVIRSELSPRHVPDRIIAIGEVPYTLNGKKCELPAKAVIAGVPPERAAALGALRNPAALIALADLTPALGRER